MGYSGGWEMLKEESWDVRERLSLSRRKFSCASRILVGPPVALIFLRPPPGGTRREGRRVIKKEAGVGVRPLRKAKTEQMKYIQNKTLRVWGADLDYLGYLMVSLKFEFTTAHTYVLGMPSARLAPSCCLYH